MLFHFHEKKVCFLRIRGREDCLEYDEKSIKIEWSSVDPGIAKTGKKEFKEYTRPIFTVFVTSYESIII